MNGAQILPDLWQVGGPGFSGPQDAASYLLRFDEKAVLIDAGCGGETALIKRNIHQCLGRNVELEYLLLTHCHFDHTGGAQGIRKAFGCKIVCHGLDAAYLERGDSEVTGASWYGSRMAPLLVDVRITKDKETLDVGSGRITAYHWPGHSPGSAVYTTKMEDRLVLFGQDVHGPIHPALLSDSKAYQMSLEKILNLNADVLCEGHFGVYRGKKAVRRFIQSFMV